MYLGDEESGPPKKETVFVAMESLEPPPHCVMFLL